MENNNKIAIDEKEYQEFIKFMNAKPNFSGFTTGDVEFAKQLFWLFEDYPSFKKKMESIGGKHQVFYYVQQFLKSK